MIQPLLFLFSLFFRSTHNQSCAYVDDQVSLCYKGNETLVSDSQLVNEHTLYGSGDALGNLFSLREVDGSASLINHYFYDETTGTLFLNESNIVLPGFSFDVPYLGAVVD